MFLINLGIDPAPANIRDDVDDDEDGPRFTDDATFADDRLYVNYIEVNGKPMAPVKMEYLPTQTVFPITVVRGNQQPFQGNRPATGIFTLPWNDAYRTGHVKLTAHWPMKIGESADLDCTGDQVNTAINFDDPGTESDSSTTNSDPFYADDSSITRETVYLIICGGISNEDHPYLELHSWDARYRGPILGGYDLTLGDRLRHYENVKARSMSAYLQGEAGHSSPSVGQFPDNGAWRRLTVSTTSPRVDIVVNPSDTDDPLVEIASSAVTSHYCPPERNDIYHHATNNRVVQLAMCEDGNGTIKVLDSGTGIEFASYTPRGKACGSDINLSAAYVTYSWWSTDCQSTRRSESYVDYYTFTLDADTSVQIDLTSSVDTYLYLIEGAESWGTDYLESDDDDGAGLDSRIERNLSAGTYTVAATTYGQNKIGSYRLRVAED